MTVEAGRERLAASTSYGSAVKNYNGQFTAKTSPPERSDRSAVLAQCWRPFSHRRKEKGGQSQVLTLSLAHERPRRLVIGYGLLHGHARKGAADGFHQNRVAGFP